MFQLHGPEPWPPHAWDDCLAYLEMPLYHGNLRGFAHKTRKDVMKARRRLLRSQGVEVSNTTEEEEVLGENSEEVNCPTPGSNDDSQAAHDAVLAAHVAELDRKNKEWQEQLARQAVEQRHQMELLLERQLAIIRGEGYSRWDGPAPPGSVPAATPEPYRPVMFDPQQPPQFPQQYAPPNFVQPPTSSFFEGLHPQNQQSQDPLDAFRNNEENDRISRGGRSGGRRSQQ